MKKLYLILLGAGLLALAAFYLFGGPLYALGKPAVSAVRVAYGQAGLTVPVSALCSDGGDHIYLLNSEQGYSRVIYTVSRAEVEIVSVLADGGAAVISSNDVKPCDRAVSGTSKPLADGDRVTLDSR